MKLTSQVWCTMTCFVLQTDWWLQATIAVSGLILHLPFVFLQENYAQHDAAKVAQVKAVYNQLELQKVYAQYEESSYHELMKLIDKLSGDLPKEMFVAYARKIYKRQK